MELVNILLYLLLSENKLYFVRTIPHSLINIYQRKQQNYLIASFYAVKFYIEFDLKFNPAFYSASETEISIYL